MTGETSYDVRIWKTDKYIGAKVTTHRVRWVVAGKSWRQGFRTAAAADSFRSGLVTALRAGEPFDITSGRPVSHMRKAQADVTWYEFACAYVDMKWPAISGNYRRGVAEALVTCTPPMLRATIREAEAKTVRAALMNWAFNAPARKSQERPEDVQRHLEWIAEHSRPISDLAEPDVLRAVLGAIGTKLDGGKAAPRTVHRKRAVFYNLLSYAVEQQHLLANPIDGISIKAPRSSSALDRQAVVNPDQARALLAAVRAASRSGPRLHAFFAVMYYSALRPEEAIPLRSADLDLPVEGGWGWIMVRGAEPDTGKRWSASGTQREARQLKHRPVGDYRRVPCPPELTAILQEHVKTYEPDATGRLFKGERGRPVATVTYTRLWQKARKDALTDEQFRSPLAKRPYDLRHAAVSTWLNGGVGSTQVAEWAGHSTDVLLKIYAKCLDGQEALALARIDAALAPALASQVQPKKRTANARQRAADTRRTSTHMSRSDGDSSK